MQLNEQKPVTVSDMIKFLEQFPRDMRIAVNGYEGGYEDPLPRLRHEMMWDFRESSYLGAHIQSKDSAGFDYACCDEEYALPGAYRAPALVLGR